MIQRTFIAAMLALLAAGPAAAQPKSKAGGELNTDESQALYLLGASLAQRASEFSLKPSDLRWVKMGLEDFVRNPAKLKVDPQTVNPKLQALRQSRLSVRGEAERKQGDEFLKGVLKQKGAKQYPSGLVMIPVKEGTGPHPKATDKVRVHYHGTLTNGKVFDSSVQRGQPAEFMLNQVIPCWTEGVQKMKVGGKAELICPAKIAYGDQGQGPIPPGATLVFEVQLLDIVK